MKLNLFQSAALMAFTLILPAGADVIYSGLKNTAIPTTFTGATVTIAGGTLNPFFGGVGVANNDLLQPFRESTSNLGTLLNFSIGTTLDASDLYLSTGYGGSQDHLGDTFSAGNEGYLGFKLNGENYGWMRVVFTGNTAGAVIKDWAYDNSGAAIVVGGIQQAAAVEGVQAVTLSLGSASALADAGSGIISRLEKTGGATTTLTGTNTYSGTTTVSGGKLLVNGSITGTGAVSVASGATLGGTGTIAGAVTVNGGILSPGASIESLTTAALTLNTGSTFEYEMDSSAIPSVAADFQKVTGDLNLSGTVNLTLTDLAVSPTAFAANTTLSLINYAGEWNHGYFTYGTNQLTDGEVFTAGLTTWQIRYGAITSGLNFASEYTPASGSFVNLTAVPEPGSLLALGCLMGAGAFLRRRRGLSIEY
jgi:autotransporter-associated beta strand protein